MIPKGDESDAGTSAATDVCGELTTVARLTLHAQKNSLAYLVGVLVVHQLGILDKLFVYGTGMC